MLLGTIEIYRLFDVAIPIDPETCREIEIGAALYTTCTSTQQHGFTCRLLSAVVVVRAKKHQKNYCIAEKERQRRASKTADVQTTAAAAAVGWSCIRYKQQDDVI